MICVSLLTLFGLSWVLLPSEGQVILPPDGNRLVFLSGSVAKIEWSLGPNTGNVFFRAWSFTSSGGNKTELLAQVVGENGDVVINTKLYEVDVIKPATLVLKNVNESYDGAYVFTAITPSTSISQVTVFIAVTPYIAVNCSSVTTVNQGDYFACECKGTAGKPSVNVTWYKNNTPIVTGKGKAILSFGNVGKDNNMTYRCEAKNVIEEAKNKTEFELFVNYPPENVRLILTRRAQKATITCTAEARPEPSFKIFLNETILVISGKTYIIPEVNNSHVGNYTCVAMSVLGKASSVSKYLSFELTPIISVNCSSVTTVEEGDNFACECEGTNGNPPADVAWYKNNTLIVTEKEEAILVFSNVNKDDSGTYRCVAKSHEKAKKKTLIELIVNWTVNCSSITTVNQSDYFACECKRTDGNSSADVTWYKDNTQIGVKGKEEAILVLSNVDKDDNGTYRCETKSQKGKNKTIQLIVNYPPENVNLKFTRSGQSVTLTCTTEARPEPSFKIFPLVKSDKTYIIPEVNVCHVGYYKCVAENILGNASSGLEYLSLVDDTCSNNTSCSIEWYIIVVTLVSGFIVGILVSYIVWCFHRRWFRNRKPKRNPDQQPTEADSTYQELDLSKMNKEDNYQSLRGNVARINDVTNDHESTYTELSKTRDVENNYQSLQSKH